MTTAANYTFEACGDHYLCHRPDGQRTYRLDVVAGKVTHCNCPCAFYGGMCKHRRMLQAQLDRAANPGAYFCPKCGAMLHFDSVYVGGRCNMVQLTCDDCGWRLRDDSRLWQYRHQLRNRQEVTNA